jgi:hypothetical protein
MFRKHALRAAAIAGVVVVLHGCSGSSEKGEQQQAVAPVTAPGPSFGMLSVEPQSGTGRDQIFHVKLERTTSSPAPALIGMLVSTGPVGTDACYVFAALDGTMMLVNDTGTGSKNLARAASVSNRQCDLLKAGSGVNTSETAISADFHLRFRPAFKGTKDIFIVAQDVAGAGPGLQAAGKWTLE